MKKYFFILFLASTLFYTEGVNAQGFSDKNDLQREQSDTLVFDENDTIDYSTMLDTKTRESPYTAAQNKYLSQPLESKTIDKTKWEQSKSGINYSNDIVEKPKKSQQNNTSFNPMWGVLFELLKWFFIIGAIILLAYLIIRFVGEGNIFGIKKRRIADPSVHIDIEHIEENLEDADIEPLISQAIANRNFTLAIRLYYLSILKELHINGDIVWKKDKTNRIYVLEMREHPLFEPFKSTTSTFERVWYGSRAVDFQLFTLIQPDFQNLLKRLK